MAGHSTSKTGVRRPFARPSTPLAACIKTWMPGTRPGMTTSWSLLAWRCGIERRIGGGRRRRLVEALDIGAGAQLLDQRPLRAMRDIVFELALDLLERRRRLDALILDFDDVPSELGLYRVGKLPLVEVERDPGKFRHHLLLGEITQVTAIGAARIRGLFFRQRGESGAGLQLREDGFGFFF